MLQKEAFANNESYKLANWDEDRKSPEGARFYEKWIKDKIVPLWEEMVRAFPEECAHQVCVCSICAPPFLPTARVLHVKQPHPFSYTHTSQPIDSSLTCRRSTE